MFTFDLVVISGLLGLACYLIVPRIMTSIEGDPLLIEDLEGRRNELRQELETLHEKSDDSLRELINHKVRRRFGSFSYLLRQYWRREGLSASLAKGRLEFKTEMSGLNDKEKRRLLLAAIEAAVTLRRVEALIYLHRLLKAWIAPHVISTSVMLALMLVHIVQVVFFNVR